MENIIKEEIPKKLYKYMPWKIDEKTGMNFAFDVIEKNHVFLQKPSFFNDPFDCAVKLEMNGGIEAWFNYLCRVMEWKNKRHLTRIEKREFRKSVRRITAEDKEKYQSYHNKVLTQPEGVTCFTKSKDNILMWSHYANNHSGICLEYEYNYLGFYPQKIDYDEEYPQINILKEKPGDILNRMYLTKAKVWEYEEEYRFMRLSHDDKAEENYQSYPEKALTAVICGCRFRDFPDMDLLINALKKRTNPVSLYKIKVSNDNFKLNVDNLVGIYGG